MSDLLATRHRQPEWMDQPAVDPRQLQASLKFIRRVNSLLGYKRAMLSHLKRFSRGWKPGERIDILDVATGSADIPRAILTWADRRGFDVRVIGLDRHAATAAMAWRWEGAARLRIIRADALAMPFGEGSFDYAITGMFLHHLDDDQVVAVLRNMDRVARRGLIVGDLLRSRQALAWIKILTLTCEAIVRHDAPASVAQAFTEPEVLSLRQRAGISYTRYYRHYGHRFALAGEKNQLDQS